MAKYAGMRGIAGAALTALLGVVNALDTSTAVIPLDLGQHDFGRELTLLFTVAESREPCGPSDIQINGQPLSTKAGQSGRDIIYEDYGSELVASWTLQCTEVNGKPVQQTIDVRIESLDGVRYEDVVFTVDFHQSSPVAILGVDGPMVDVPAVDVSGGYDHDFWAQNHSGDEEGSGVEIGAARSEIQFLRIQQREIGDRIKELEKFIRESDGEGGECRGPIRCLVRGLFDKVAGVASKAYETVMGPNDDHSQDEYPYRNGSDANPTTPSRKRPLWQRPFCPCAPSSTPTAVPAPPPDPEPEAPPAVDDKPPAVLPDVPDYTNPHLDPPKLDIPDDIPSDNKDKTPEAVRPADFSAARRSLITLLFISLLITAFILIRRVKEVILHHSRDLIIRWRHFLTTRRLQRRRRQRRAAFVAYVRALIPGIASRRCEADMEQQQQQEPQQPPAEDMMQRTRRSQSDASNTMEQDLAQFRAAVDMVGHMVATGGEQRPPQQHLAGADVGGVTSLGAVSDEGFARRPGSAGSAYPQELPPAYESEEEDSPMLSSISDGFRQGYGSSGYMPGRGGSSDGNADALRFGKP